MRPPTYRGPRHFVDLATFDPAQLRAILDEAHRRKAARVGATKGAKDADAPLIGHALAMIFQKNSTRTRVSFEIGMHQLGGKAIVLNANDTQLGRGETVEDTARVLSRMVDAVMIRANNHQDVVDFAAAATVPVINGLTDKTHPCQIVADIMTFEERKGSIKGRKVAWAGDGNNVAASWIHAAARLDFNLTLACPPQLNPENAVLQWAKREGADIELTDDPVAAARGADCVVTDTWVSMGQEDAPRRKQLLGPYAVNDALMKHATDDAIFMHCLPAYRGHEVSASVIDGPQSVVWDEAENRLHAQKAILAWCLGVD